MKRKPSDATAATLAQLETVVWFRSVGYARGRYIEPVPTWQDALRHNEEPVWENVQLEAANQLVNAILHKSPERYRLWNDVVDVVKPITTELVKRKIGDVVRDRGLPKAFEDSVQWDVLHLAMEAEYSDVVPVGFFANLAYWYREGHWPCGWEGTLETGRLLVF